MLSDAAIQFCRSIKCLFNLARHQSLGLVESCLRLADLDQRAFYSCSIIRRQKIQRVRLPCWPVPHALDRLVTALASST